MNRRLTLHAVLGLALVAPLTAQKHKELGRMWTFEDVPLEFFKQEYDFAPTAKWLEHARLSAIKFGGGCSSSFVSPHGLIMTNHHCARSYIAKLSPKGKDWLATGFFAGSLAKEVKVDGLTVQQLIWTRNVSEVIASGTSSQEIIDAEKAKDPDLNYQVVSLYQGGMYQLYAHKVFRDIRLVAAPHMQSAKFGGDPDNFTFPRYSLDFTFCRAWEDGKPADTTRHYLKWKTAGPSDGETVFVIGNPGSTGRLNTIAQMEFLRDHTYPSTIKRYQRAMDSARKRSDDKPEDPTLRARVLSLENGLKAIRGYLDGLQNEKVMTQKRAAEAAIRAKVDADPKLKEKFGDAWTALEDLTKKKVEALEASGRVPSELRREETRLGKRIGEAFFAVYGTDIPPDATLTLRISDGRVKGYPYNGTIAPATTSLYGLFGRHTDFGGKPPFHLPKVWLERLKKLDMTTPFNLVTTCDIIGGNSGSAMINTSGEVVGLVFDGNIEMLGNRFVFTDEVARTVCVHPAIIIEALRKIYGAGKLADEIEKGRAYK